ncbi:MAG: sugar transferase [Chloroflexia bacterium]
MLRCRLNEWPLDAPPTCAKCGSAANAGGSPLRQACVRHRGFCSRLHCRRSWWGEALLIKLESRGPVLADTPKRAGRGGSEFRMYKFRGMVENAHMMLVNDPLLWEEYKKNNFKLPNDPRLTRVGKAIRAASIDELPNLINVLHGEMSIVGPRPRYPFEIVAQADRVGESQPDILRMLTVKPGVTGPWQVGGRSNVGYEERTSLEACYAQDHNLWKDFVICLKTVRTVVTKEGAH